ncbi:MAG: glycoside hydrolase family 25 protein [Tepidisphaeraceae bacterium]
MDVSNWQGTINWTAVQTSGIQFAFIRASRGGTTGFYDQNDPDNSNGLNTLSQRYDDTKFVTNITTAKSKGILAGPYHFLRADILTYDNNGTTVTHTGTDEADHFLQQAGAYMKPGYLLPVCDVEAGASQRSAASLTAFVQAFSDRVFAVKGVRPIIYINGSYANSEVQASLNTHPLWLARWDSTIDPQTDDPPATGSYPNIYGVWNPTYPNTPTPKPWKFWQYTSTGRNPGIGSGNSNVDLDVFNGDYEGLKDYLVPALWMVDADGTWTAGTNWNGNPDLPASLDRCIINRPAGNYLVTLSSGAQSVRSLQLNERLNITGGSLTSAQYANLDNALTVSGAGALTAASIKNTSTLTLTGGSITTAGAITGTNGSVTVSGGTLSAASIDQTTLSVVGGTARLTGTTTSLVRSLALSGTGLLDLRAAKLAINYTGSSPLASVRNALANGNLDSTTLPSNQTLACVEATTLLGASPTTWAGVTIDSTSLLVMPALLGDANLDGTVNFTDLLTLAASYGSTTGTWTTGDSTHDSSVNFNDLLALAGNYGTSLTGSFASDFALAQSMVPEPSMLVVLGASLVVLRRARHRGHGEHRDSR